MRVEFPKDQAFPLAADDVHRRVDAGCSVTVWNRTPGKAHQLTARGTVEAATAHEALIASDVIVACLYDHASVLEVLDAEAAPWPAAR